VSQNATAMMGHSSNAECKKCMMQFDAWTSKFLYDGQELESSQYKKNLEQGEVEGSLHS
jgi:hypothetical protein